MGKLVLEKMLREWRVRVIMKPWLLTSDVEAFQYCNHWSCFAGAYWININPVTMKMNLHPPTVDYKWDAFKNHSWYALSHIKSYLPKHKSMNLKPGNDQILLSWFNLILLLEQFPRDSSVTLCMSLSEPIQGWHCVAMQRKTTMRKGIVWGVVWHLFFSHLSRPMCDSRIKEIIRDVCLSTISNNKYEHPLFKEMADALQKTPENYKNKILKTTYLPLKNFFTPFSITANPLHLLSNFYNICYI